MKRSLYFFLLLMVIGFGQLSFAQNSVSGTATYARNNSQIWPMKNITILLSQDSSTLYQTNTDSTGYYSFTNIPDGSYTLTATTTRPWGYASSSDELAIMKHFIGIAPLTGIALIIANVNNDQAVNSIDALLVARRFVCQIISFPSADWYFEKFTVILNGDTITQNIKGACYGDANLSGSPN